MADDEKIHREWIFSDNSDIDLERILFDQLERPEEAKFYVKVYDEKKGEYTHTDSFEKRAVTKEELDTIVSKEPIKIIDKGFDAIGNISIDIIPSSEKGVTLRDFLETLYQEYTMLWDFLSTSDSDDPSEKKKIHFCQVENDGEIIWDYFSGSV